MTNILQQYLPPAFVVDGGNAVGLLRQLFDQTTFGLSVNTTILPDIYFCKRVQTNTRYELILFVRM